MIENEEGEIVQALNYAFQNSTTHSEKIHRENLVSVLNIHQAFLFLSLSLQQQHDNYLQSINL